MRRSRQAVPAAVCRARAARGRRQCRRPSCAAPLNRETRTGHREARRGGVRAGADRTPLHPEPTSRDPGSRAAPDMCGADMEVDACQMTQRAVLAWQQTDMRIDAVCRRMQRLVEHPVATLDPVLCDLRTNEIERAALPCTPTLNGCVLGMEPADAGSDARRREQKLVADPNLTGVNCTGDDRAG